MTRLTVALPLVAVSAALYATAFPPLAWRWCAWLALVPLLTALRGRSVAGAALLGVVWAVLAAAGVGTWFATGVARYYDRPLVLGAFCFAGVALILAAPFYAAFCAAYAYLAREPRLRTFDALWVPAAWVACELARARFLVGNPWALLGYTQIGWTPMVQIADVAGVYGVSFVVASANAAIAGCIDDSVEHARKRGPVVARDVCWRGLAIAGALTIATLAYGLATTARATFNGTPLDVAVVQTSADVGTAWRPELYGANLDAYLQLSNAALRRDHPDVVIWPEAAVTFFLEDEAEYRAAIARVFHGSGAQLIAGGPAHDDGAAQARYFNSAFLVDAEASILDRYDKVRLVPFGEYFPLPQLEPLRRRFAATRTFTPGTRRAPLAGGGRAFATVICFEAMYPELVSEQVTGGATLLVNLTNDAWMGDTSFAPLHLAIASLRAVENRRYLVRAATTGISGVVDPFGRIVATIPAFAQGVRTVRVQAITDTTFYTRHGDAFAVLCALATAALLVTVAARRARQLP